MLMGKDAVDCCWFENFADGLLMAVFFRKFHFCVFILEENSPEIELWSRKVLWLESFGACVKK